MSVARRIALAMKGTREERAILIRDPNRIVTAAVLSSPKMNDTEVAAIAKMQNVSEDVLRTIANNRAWLKNYSVVLAVVKNPKTPGGAVDEPDGAADREGPQAAHDRPQRARRAACAQASGNMDRRRQVGAALRRPDRATASSGFCDSALRGLRVAPTPCAAR